MISGVGKGERWLWHMPLVLQRKSSLMFNLCMKRQREKKRRLNMFHGVGKRTSGMKSVNPEERDNMESHDQLFNMMLC